MIPNNSFSNIITVLAHHQKATAQGLWVLLGTSSTRFRAAWALPLFIFGNEREMRNGCFLIGARVHMGQKNDGILGQEAGDLLDTVLITPAA